MERIIEKIEKVYFQKNIKYTFWATIIVGIFSHGYMLTNKFSYHDDLGNLFSVGTTYAQGRWFLGMMSKFTRVFLGGDYSIPFYNGLLSIVILAIMSCAVTCVLELRNMVSCILVGGMTVAFPVVACTLGYGFTSYYYFIALLMCVVAALLVHNKKKIWNAMIAAMLLCFSLATYQAYYPVTAVLMVLCLLKQSFAERADWKTILKEALYYALILMTGIIMYLTGTSVINKIRGTALSGYSNMDSMGKISIEDIPNAIKNVFVYLHGKDAIIYNLFDGFAGVCIYALYLISIGLFIALCVLKRADFMLLIERVLFFISLPFAINLICIMAPKSHVYSLMVYPMMFVFVIPLFFVELIGDNKNVMKMMVHGGIAILVGISIVFYVRMDNRFYLKEEFLKSQTNSYFTAMVTQIKSLEGYSDEMPIAYLNLDNFHDETLTHMEPLIGIELRPFHRNELITEGSMAKYIDYWCGYSPKLVDDEMKDILLQMEEVKNMPSYPDNKGIRIIDNIIVVKF